MLRGDFHVHTRYSPDCRSRPDKIVARCVALGIDCIAICDHNTTDGAFEVKRIAPFRVIVAEEVRTASGEVMGMFLQEPIPKTRSIDKVIDAIHAQGGLVNIPHPFIPLFGLRLSKEGWQNIAQRADMMEVFNARSFPWPDARARAFARDHDLPGTAGSDAHSIREIGNVAVELDDFGTPLEFLRSLRKAKINGRRRFLSMLTRVGPRT